MTTAPAPEAEQRPGSRRRGRRLDLAIGILLGIVLGIAVVSAFVFLGEAGSIDSSHIEGVDTGKRAPALEAGAEPGARSEPGRGR